MEKLIKNDIGVYTAHTNIDIAEFGLNDYIANTLGRENRLWTAEMYYKISGLRSRGKDGGHSECSR